jgi:hypothetical protein
MGYRLYALPERTVEAEKEIGDKYGKSICLFSAYDSDVFDALDSYESEVKSYFITREDFKGLFEYMVETFLDSKKEWTTNPWKKIEEDLTEIAAAMVKTPYDEMTMEAW